MSDFLTEMNEEALPQIDEADLVYGAKIAPLPEGTYAVKATLGNGGIKYDEAKKAFTVHAVLRVIKPLKVYDGKAGRLVNASEIENSDKIFFNPDGSGKAINDFFRISATNKPGVQKVVQFMKYAGDKDYNTYGTNKALAEALVSVLKLEPGDLKLNGRWRASIDTGEVDPTTHKKIYENKNGAKNFPRRDDGSVSHVIELAGEQVQAQFEVVEYGELTERDAQ